VDLAIVFTTEAQYKKSGLICTEFVDAVEGVGENFGRVHENCGLREEHARCYSSAV